MANALGFIALVTCWVSISADNLTAFLLSGAAAWLASYVAQRPAKPPRWHDRFKG